MSSETLTGSCNCKSISFSCGISKREAHICHCNLCQKSMGGPSHTVTIIPGSLTIKDESNVSWYQSSEWAQRGFCKSCGSNMFFRVIDEKSEPYQGVSVGMLDDKSGFTIDSHIFVDKNPGYYDFKDDAPRLTEEQFYQMISDKG